MGILVVVKTTNYELFGKEIERKVAVGDMARDTLTRLVSAHEEHKSVVQALEDELGRHQLPYKLVNRDDRWTVSPDTSVVISIGGDGTLLSASHKFEHSDAVLVGIKSSQHSIGYLCATPPSGIANLVKRIAKGQLAYQMVSRLVGEVFQVRERKTIVTPPVLNDFLYANSNPACTSRYIVSYGDSRERQRSSGIWVSTAVGSSAVMSAAGGSTQSWDDQRFQFKVRELYRPHGENLRIEHGYFNPDEQPFVIESLCESAILATDGQHGVISLELGDRITFRQGPSLKIGTKL